MELCDITMSALNRRNYKNTEVYVKCFEIICIMSTSSTNIFTVIISSSETQRSPDFQSHTVTHRHKTSSTTKHGQYPDHEHS